MKNSTPIHDITNAIPESVICVAVDVKPRSIRLARERGVFPASWYTVVTSLCAEYGLDCPDSLFNFKSPTSGASTKGVNASAVVQPPVVKQQSQVAS